MRHRLLPNHRYLKFSMLRQLLTLLAVISGLTLVAQPAHALDADIVSIAEAADSQCDIKGTAPIQLTTGVIARAEQDKPCRKVRILIWIPPVMLQADRAWE